MPAQTIEEALARQDEKGSTAAQFQTTDTGAFIRKANEDARRTLDAARARGPVDPVTGIATVDLSHIDPEHVRGISTALTPAIKRATSRVSSAHMIPIATILAFEQALKEEIAVEFWRLGGHIEREYSDLRGDLQRDRGDATHIGAGTGEWQVDSGGTPGGAGGTVSGAGTIDNGGTVAAGGSIVGSGTVDSGTSSSTTSSGSVDSAGTVTSAGTVVNAGTVDNAGTASG